LELKVASAGYVDYKVQDSIDNHTHTINQITDFPFSLTSEGLEVDMSDLYNKIEINDLLENKADKSNTYTKEEIDAKINEAMDEMVRKRPPFTNSQEVN